MKAKMTYLFVLCSLLKMGTAQIYFNNRYDTFGSCDGAGIIDTFNNKFITAGFTCSSVSFYALNLRLYDQTGTTTVNKTYHWPGNNFQTGKGFVKNGNNYLLSGTRYYKNDTSLVYQWIFDTNLDSVKYTEYGYLNKGNVVYDILDYNHINYFMAGQVYDNLYNSDILLIKTDTSGNEIWKKKIDLPGWDETAWCIKISSDQKLLISGNKRVHNNQSTNGAYILKVDTNGSVLWEQYFSSNKGLAATGLIELPNTDIVAIAGKGYGSTTRMELIKLDASGNLIFDKAFGPSTDHAEPYAMVMNNNGNLVAVGQNYYPSMGGLVNGLMYEFSQNGDSLFSREYTVEPGSQNYFRDVVQAPDKGYVFSGFITPVFPNGGTGTQDIWLLKTDSTFCESMNSCNYPTGIMALNSGADKLTAYPNPAQHELYIKLENNNAQHLHITLKDISGRMMTGCRITTTDNEVRIDVSNLANGTYYCTIEQTNRPVVAGKIIILK